MKDGLNAKNVAVVLSGCGVYDGSEIHESVCVLLNLVKRGARVAFFAPDIEQSDVVNHMTGACEGGVRRVMEESARIARGNVLPLSGFNAAEFDALVFPGGFGAAKNLSTFARDGAGCSVNADVERAIKAMAAAGKKTAFVCISPVIAAKVIGGGVRLTIGSDKDTAAALAAMGAEHVECSPKDFVCDEKFGVYSTPAYMSAADISEVDEGVGKMIAEMLK